MGILLVVLRFVHIFGGVFWAGSTFVMYQYVQPSVTATQPESNKFMQYLMGSSGYVMATSIAPGLTVLAGLLLYWIDSSGLQLSWITTPVGLGFTVGSIAGLAAMILGAAVARPTAGKMAELGKAMQTAGKPPSPEQVAQMKKYQETMTSISLWVAVLLVVTVTFMAIARYL
jgi:uncharacterized membrane protein